MLSVMPSQLSSLPLHSSVPPGLMALFVSSQSPGVLVVYGNVSPHKHFVFSARP